MISKYKRELAETLIGHVLDRRTGCVLEGRVPNTTIQIEYTVYTYDIGAAYLVVTFNNRDEGTSRRFSYRTSEPKYTIVKYICNHVKKPTLEQAIARYDGLIFNQ